MHIVLFFYGKLVTLSDSKDGEFQNPVTSRTAHCMATVRQYQLPED